MIILCDPVPRIRYELQIGASDDDAAFTGSSTRRSRPSQVHHQTGYLGKRQS
jgi:hypothetical protein